MNAQWAVFKRINLGGSNVGFVPPTLHMQEVLRWTGFTYRRSVIMYLQGLADFGYSYGCMQKTM